MGGHNAKSGCRGGILLNTKRLGILLNSKPTAHLFTQIEEGHSLPGGRPEAQRQRL